MLGRNILPLGIVVASACFLTVSAGAAFAGETPPAAPASEVLQAPTPSAAAPTPARDLCQKEIFEILKGGAEKADPGLMDHLWRMAGNLACRDWTPPTVTVQVVVADVSGLPR